MGERSQYQCANRGDLILSATSSGYPTLVQKVRYFVKEGQLAYELTGEEITQKGKSFVPRDRGDTEVIKRR